MDSDRRNNFRAALSATREGLLVARGQSLRVRIVDESSGGLGVSSMRSCPFPDGATLRLSTDDGDVLAVQIMHRRKEGRRTIIGLQRIADPTLLRTESRGTRPLILLAGITLGLYAGFALRMETIREYASRLPGLTHAMSHH